MHYAAVVKSGKILSIGVSGLRGCAKLSKNAVTRHAEMDALSQIKDRRKLRRASLWSIRWRQLPDGSYEISNAKPCLYCKNLALKYGLRVVYYSNENGNIIKSSILNLDSKLTYASVLYLQEHRNLSKPPTIAQ